jgi:arginine-tRNA-protein transferase
MAYKTAFRPLERLGRDGWRQMEEGELDVTSNDPLTLPTRRSAKRLLVDA